MLRRIENIDISFRHRYTESYCTMASMSIFFRYIVTVTFVLEGRFYIPRH